MKVLHVNAGSGISGVWPWGGGGGVPTAGITHIQLVSVMTFLGPHGGGPPPPPPNFFLFTLVSDG